MNREIGVKTDWNNEAETSSIVQMSRVHSMIIWLMQWRDGLLEPLLIYDKKLFLVRNLKIFEFVVSYRIINGKIWNGDRYGRA